MSHRPRLVVPIWTQSWRSDLSRNSRQAGGPRPHTRPEPKQRSGRQESRRCKIGASGSSKKLGFLKKLGVPQRRLNTRFELTEKIASLRNVPLPIRAVLVDDLLLRWPLKPLRHLLKRATIAAARQGIVRMPAKEEPHVVTALVTTRCSRHHRRR